MILSDVNKPLMVMWEHLFFKGWIPPETVSEEDYNFCKSLNDSNDPMTAYVGFGMSFSAKFWGGYARNKRLDRFDIRLKKSVDKKVRSLLHINLKRSTNLKLKSLHNIQIELHCRDYKFYERHKNCVFYLDPPYQNRTKQSKFKFDNEEFWDFARKLSVNNLVFITEFIAPGDFVSIYDFGDTVVRHQNSKGKDGTVESIFMCESYDKEMFK